MLCLVGYLYLLLLCIIFSRVGIPLVEISPAKHPGTVKLVSKLKAFASWAWVRIRAFPPVARSTPPPKFQIFKPQLPVLSQYVVLPTVTLTLVMVTAWLTEGATKNGTPSARPAIERPIIFLILFIPSYVWKFMFVP